MATILYYFESMTIEYSGLDQREGKRCPPLGPTVSKVNSIGIRPRGADIIDIVQDGDVITITANGNGTGTVTVSAWLDKDSEPILSLDPRGSQGCFETSKFGSKSVVNTLSPAYTEEIIVLEPPLTVDMDAEINDPEKDCEEEEEEPSE